MKNITFISFKFVVLLLMFVLLNTIISQDKSTTDVSTQQFYFEHKDIVFNSSYPKSADLLGDIFNLSGKYTNGTTPLIPLVVLADFESGTFPPTGWTINPYGYPIRYSRANVSGYMIGTGSCKYDFWNMEAYSFNVLITSVLNPPLRVGDTLKFDFAKAYGGGNEVFSIEYSTNSGSDPSIQMVSYIGATFATTTNSGSPFTPSSSSQWATKTIINLYNNNIVKLGFTCAGALSGQGNNLYIDNIRVYPAPVINPPSPPSLISPSNNATNVSLTPTLDWSDVSGAASYGVQVSPNPSFTPLVVYQSSIGASQYTVPSGQLAPATLYYWRANASNPGGTSSWSGVYTFTTTSGPPPAPTLISPPNGSTNISITPTLDWSDVSGANSYSIQVSTNSGFSPTIVSQSGLGSSQYTVPGGSLSGGNQYFWRVNATNSNGTSAWSSPFSFTTVTPVSYQRIEFYEQNINFNSSNPLNLIDPGRYVRFKLNILNGLTVNILTGYGNISTTTPNVTITDNACTFNNVLSGQSAWSVDEFEILIGENFTPGTRITITLTVTQQITPTGPWISIFSFPVKPMIVSSFLTDDDNNPDSYGNNNHICEPGETIEIIPLVKNISQDIMYTNKAQLTSPITWLNIWNGVTGVSGVVYDTWRLNVVSNVPQPIQPGVDGIQPEQDYVFNYNASQPYNLPMYDFFTSYYSGEAGGNWWSGGIKLKYSAGFRINPSSPPPIGIQNLGGEIPKEYKLYANYPNPFNPQTKIAFDIPKSSETRIVVYDVMGRITETLVNERLNAGKYEVTWSGANYSSGIYFYQIQSLDYTETKKMLLIK